jgi:energy-coupling factor transporter transmembrane protein EcfT
VRPGALAAVLAVALAGCGSSSSAGASGRATVWVTRDRGAVVLHAAKVPAGVSAMQALDRVAEVKTRFGGRYVRAVDGVEERGNRAWFYYVNGYLADRSAAEYRLRPGDLEWWDYRAWRDPAQDPVVIGAFPQPFLNGYDGKRRPAVVVSSDPRARAVARRLRARVLPAGTKAALDANAVVLGACLCGPSGRRRLYLIGALGSGLAVFLVTPFVSTIGWHVLWSGPTVPVLGQLDVTREELRIGLFQGLRLTAVALAFAAYALLLDHDRLVQSARFARRSVLAIALATRLVPTLERDAAGLVEALRGRGVEVSGARARARLLSPLLAGSLERALNLAEAMEARGYGRPGATRAPRPAWGLRERSALVLACVVVAIGALWL